MARVASQVTLPRDISSADDCDAWGSGARTAGEPSRFYMVCGIERIIGGVE